MKTYNQTIECIAMHNPSYKYSDAARTIADIYSLPKSQCLQDLLEHKIKHQHNAELQPNQYSETAEKLYGTLEKHMTQQEIDALRRYMNWIAEKPK